MPEKRPDLTSPENVAAGEQVYQRIETSQVTDVTAELDATYNTEEG